MGISADADTALRDYETDGVAGSGAHKPGKAELRALFAAIDGAIFSAGAGSSGGGGSEQQAAAPEIAFQNFKEVADGTLLSGFVLDTGQTLTLQGVAGATAHVVNADGHSGYALGSDIFYAVLDFPHKNFIASMEVVWPTGTDGTDGIAMGCGRYVGGAIISKMCHAQWDFDLPYLTLWGSDHNSTALSYLVQDDIADKNSYTNATKTSAHDQIIRCTVVVVDNVAAMYYNNGQISNQFAYLGAGGGANNGSISSLVGNYIYFECTGTNSPKIRSIYARELTEEECLAIMLPPLPAPGNKLQPKIYSGDIPFATATEIFRFTPGDTLPGTTFKIKLGVFSNGAVAGYCQQFTEWVVTGHKHAGTLNANAYGPDLSHLSSENSGVISVSGAITAVISGSVVIVKATITRTGSDVTSYSPHYEAHVEQYGDTVAL